MYCQADVAYPADPAVMAELAEEAIEMEEEEGFMSFDQLIPYVIAWPTDLHPGTSFETMFLVVLKRAGGLIGAIPLGVISEEEIRLGISETSAHAMLGASTAIMVPGVHKIEMAAWSFLAPRWLFRYFTAQVADLMRLMVPDKPVFAFVSDQPSIFPKAEDLVSQVLEWARSPRPGKPEGPYP